MVCEQASLGNLLDNWRYNERNMLPKIITVKKTLQQYIKIQLNWYFSGINFFVVLALQLSCKSTETRQIFHNGLVEKAIHSFSHCVIETTQLLESSSRRFKKFNCEVCQPEEEKIESAVKINLLSETVAKLAMFRSGELQLTGYMACWKRRSKKGCRKIAAKEVTVTQAVSAQRSAACTKVVAFEWMIDISLLQALGPWGSKIASGGKKHEHYSFYRLLFSIPIDQELGTG